MARSSPRRPPTCSGWRSTWSARSRSPSRSRRPSRKGEVAQGARSCERERARIDERFDPEAALEGAARYLAIANERFGCDGPRDRLLPHGNRQPGVGDRPATTVTSSSYAQLFFDSAPDRNAEAHDILAGFADDSSLYFWRDPGLRADHAAVARRVRRARADGRPRHREGDSRGGLPPRGRDQGLRRPRGDRGRHRRPSELLPLPPKGGPGWEVDEQMGELAPELGREPGALPRTCAPRPWRRSRSWARRSSG